MNRSLSNVSRRNRKASFTVDNPSSKPDNTISTIGNSISKPNNTISKLAQASSKLNNAIVTPAFRHLAESLTPNNRSIIYFIAFFNNAYGIKSRPAPKQLSKSIKISINRAAHRCRQIISYRRFNTIVPICQFCTKFSLLRRNRHRRYLRDSIAIMHTRPARSSILISQPPAQAYSLP
jgi:hypothetical protein